MTGDDMPDAREWLDAWWHEHCGHLSIRGVVRREAVIEMLSDYRRARYLHAASVARAQVQIRNSAAAVAADLERLAASLKRGDTESEQRKEKP